MMLDTHTCSGATPSTSALVLFDRAMKIHAIRADIVRAAQELNCLSDRQLSEMGINRTDIDEMIARYI
ncbi:MULTISPECIES: hypothetical protein [Ruegeria]|uniref:hypothetical protein n=2 Tax=Roseobacteraceae TaxID=2854170 RepID=UPI001479FFCD|nr:hypothetical protein [Ruegeria lacuscaerulensis]